MFHHVLLSGVGVIGVGNNFGHSSRSRGAKGAMAPWLPYPRPTTKNDNFRHLKKEFLKNLKPQFAQHHIYISNETFWPKSLQIFPLSIV